MDDPETLHRRARLRELVDVAFGGRLVDLIEFVYSRTGKRPNQGELSALRVDNGSKSFGDKKARTLTDQIGLHRRWFDFPIGTNMDRERWMADIAGSTPPPQVEDVTSEIKKLVAMQNLLSERSQKTLQTLVIAAKKNSLSEEHWALIDDLVRRFLVDRSKK